MGDCAYLGVDNILSYLHVSVQFKYLYAHFFINADQAFKYNKCPQDIKRSFQLVYCKFYRKKKTVLRKARVKISESINMPQFTQKIIFGEFCLGCWENCVTDRTENDWRALRR